MAQTGGTVAGLPAELAILWRALHQRFGSGITVTALRIGPMNIAGEEAAANLLGMAKLPAEAVVTEAVRLTAREMAEQLVGTIENCAAARAAQTDQRTELEAAA